MNTLPTVAHKLLADPFDETERDPLHTKAIDSSLWELATLRNHYLANISTLAKIFEEAFTKPSYDLEDFLDHAYSTVSVCCASDARVQLIICYSCLRRK